MTKFEQYVHSKAVQYAGKFDGGKLYPQFIDAFNGGYRVEVEFVSDKGEVYETKRGTIGATTGWVPCFLLMLTKRSIGSIYTLGKNDRIKSIVAVK